MLEAINGILKEKTDIVAVVDVNGIEFKIVIPASTYKKLPERGDSCRLFVEFVIGERSIKLYGFATKEERALFNELRKISKIGAQTAIVILSNVSVEEFYDIIKRQNKDALIRIPGVGKKTALNIIVEMSQKIPKMNDTISTPSILIEAIDALVNLGFQKSKAENVVGNIYYKNPTISLDELIKESLRYLGRNAN